MFESLDIRWKIPPNLVDKPIIYRIRGTLFTSKLDVIVLDRYHKAVTPSGVNFGKDLMSLWHWTNLDLNLMYKSLCKSHKGDFQWTFLWSIWHVPCGGWFLADAGPTSVLLGRRRAIGGHVFSATWDISLRIIMVVLHIAFCEFEHCVFIFPCFVLFVVWP